MSHRRNQGRFTNTSSTEAMQRQLAAPAYRWKKAWVAPAGIAPESSYKICKWVRTEKGEEEDEDAFSVVLDGEDDDMNGDEADDQAETPLDDVATPTGETPLPTPDGEPPSSNFPHAPPLSSGLANPPLTALTSENQAHSPLPTATDALAEHSLPSNAIEMANTAPGHVEEGQGDLGGGDVHLEVHTSGTSAAAGNVPPPNDMDMTEAGDAPVDNDAGLVHGEMDAPEPGLEVVGGDHPPPEVEKS